MENVTVLWREGKAVLMQMNEVRACCLGGTFRIFSISASVRRKRRKIVKICIGFNAT